MGNIKKENAIGEFDKMIKNSWTYDRMTEEERTKWDELLKHNRTLEAIKGNTKQRWTTLNALYFTYLIGIGYDGHTWRETEAAPLF